MPFIKTAISEGRRLWPFTVGFGITFAIVLKHALSLKPEDAMKSPYINPDAPRKLQSGYTDEWKLLFFDKQLG